MPYTFCGLIGQSAGMYELYSLIQRASRHNCPVLILGESGTGKELVAHAIHDLGPRAIKPFTPVDCAAMTATLVESELFGHVKGAFTGADYSKRGLLQAADNGTVLLDEIGELPLSLQAKLLRSLQEKEIRLVGSTERIPLNIRIIAATNRDLEAGVREGTFRLDLFYRLNVVRIKIPALRERNADIPLLADYFLKKFSDPLEREHVRAISDGAMHRLMSYDWPGNIRELQNVMESAIALTSNAILNADDLACIPHNASSYGHRSYVTGTLAETERHAVVEAMLQTGGNKVAAARILRIGKTTLYRKLKQYSNASRTEKASSEREALLK
jgi:transcriptional regulator with PAS, ATPase and Fis domain